MPVRHAEAVWTGNLREGQGVMKFGTFEGAYTRASRFEEAEGTNPEELLGAAHAGCFSMFLSSVLTKAGTPPTRIVTMRSGTYDQRVFGAMKKRIMRSKSPARVSGS